MAASFRYRYCRPYRRQDGTLTNSAKAKMVEWYGLPVRSIASRCVASSG